MRLKLSVILLFLSAPVLGQQQLVQDSAVRKGQLPNGLTYYIRHNAQTPGQADFYIAQRVGSILEQPNQRGLAHLLEHMAFNGTTNFPGAEKGGGLRDWCERKGIKFGANLNAYTSVDQTVYNISSAPVSKPGVADTCLLILHDWSHFILLRDDEIDKERGVIHEEWRNRRSGMAVQRLMEEAMPVIYKGTKYADCLPIGSMDVVDHFPYQALRDYYAKWYRPDLQAVIVVGDVDVDSTEQTIRRMFANVPAPVNPAERIYYPVSDNERMIIFRKQDSEQPIPLFTLYMKRPTTPRNQRATMASFRDDYISNIIRMALNERLDQLQAKAVPPFVSASVADGNFFISQTKDAFRGNMACKSDRILDGIRALVGEIERMRQHGITASEMNRGKKELLRWAESDLAETDKQRNGQLVGACLKNFLNGDALISDAEALRLTQIMDSTVTINDVNAAIKDIITDRNQVVTLYGPDKDGFRLPANSVIEKTILTAQAMKYEPYVDEIVDTTLITEALPGDGRIVSESDTLYGYHQFVLSNGMRVLAKPTDYEADNISLDVFADGGFSLWPDEDIPNLKYLANVIGKSGVGRFDSRQLDKALAGRRASVTPYITEDQTGMSGSSDKQNLKTLLQLVHLYFTQPRRDDQAFANLMDGQRAMLKNREASPMVIYRDSLVRAAYGDNERLKPMTVERLEQLNLDRMLHIYRQSYQHAGDFTMMLTGSIDMDALRPLLCRYIATLPKAAGADTIIDRNINLRPVDETHRFRRTMATPTARTTIFISAPMEYSVQNSTLLDVLCQIMRMVYTEKVREEKGGAYSVGVSGDMQRLPYGEAFMKISFTTDPAKYPDVIPIIYRELQAMAQNGPAAEQLSKVKEYEHKVYQQVVINNDYWAYVMKNLLVNHADIDTGYLDRVDAITPSALRLFCSRLLQAKHRIEVTMLPR